MPVLKYLQGLALQTLISRSSPRAAAYINGLAGQLAADGFGPAVLATDLIDYIPEAIPKV